MKRPNGGFDHSKFDTGHRWRKFQTCIGTIWEYMTCRTWTSNINKLKSRTCYGKEIK